MARTPRDFSKRTSVEQKMLLEHTWCEMCKEPDLGMTRPVEFEENGEIIIEGVCVRCGSPVRNTIVEEHR